VLGVGAWVVAPATEDKLEAEGEELDWLVAELVLDTTEALDWLAVELMTGPAVEELLGWLLVELPLDKVEELLV
jgi:hypothetical protein